MINITVHKVRKKKQFWKVKSKYSSIFVRTGEPQSHKEPHIFEPLELESLPKKIQKPEPLEKKIQELELPGKEIRSQSRLEKKSGAGAKKIIWLPSPDFGQA